MNYNVDSINSFLNLNKSMFNEKFIFLLVPRFIFSQLRDTRSNQFNFFPGELIVKLKDDVDAGVVYASVGQAPASLRICGSH